MTTMIDLKLTPKADRLIITEHQFKPGSLPCAMIDVDGHTGAIVVFAQQQAQATGRAKQIVRALALLKRQADKQERRRRAWRGGR